MKSQIPSITKHPCQTSWRVLILVLIVFGVVVPLFIQVMLLMQQSSVKDEAVLASHKVLYVDIAKKKSEVDSLENQVKELEIIRIKALGNLVKLDEKRVNLISQIQQLTTDKNVILKESNIYAKQVQKLKKEANLVQETRSQKVITNILYVGIPKKGIVNSHHTNKTVEGCSFEVCFDFSRCSILKEFKFYLYKPNSKDLNRLYRILAQFPEHSVYMKQACIYVVLLRLGSTMSSINTYLNNLPTWKGTGVNHLVILDIEEGNTEHCNKITELLKTKAILVTPTLCNGYHSNHNFLIPTLSEIERSDNTWHSISPLFPVQRNHLLFFASQFFKGNNTSFIQEEDVVELSTESSVYIKVKCNSKLLYKCTKGWCKCGPADHRNSILQNSTFVIIPVENINDMFFDDIRNSLKYGTIPVLIGSTKLLPFSELIDWKLASVIIPYQRLPELYYMLQTMPIDDVVALKLQGRFLYEAYFLTKDSLLRTVFTALKNKIGLPPVLIKGYTAANINNLTSVPEDSHRIAFSSLRLINNYSYIGKDQYKSWNKFPGALHMYPVIPWNTAVPSKIQFLNEGQGQYMPIGDGRGGDGTAFARSLGGDFPGEKFTVLMLTYDREIILMEALQRLSGMKYLNKVIVVWNHPVDPAKELQWPDIGVKIEIIRAKKNSLNNRFIPYDIIETEAILSMDDDIYLRHDEIELAFRVWRENRDRLVGFPGRHHAYNSSSKSFYYSSEHSCELSLVLTGGAFFHKYYSYVYTYNMASSIREMVDDYMNCEDIAMNFLVAHITQKPPIKVTSRWTFRCPGCPVALSADASHYEERNTCMEFFEKVYGYNPLKRTQFRADSILFKTRLPSAMTKCFQFV